MWHNNSWSCCKVLTSLIVHSQLVKIKLKFLHGKVINISPHNIFGIVLQGGDMGEYFFESL